MKRITLFALILLFSAAGCEQKQEPPQPEQSSRPATAVELKLPTPKKIFAGPAAAHKFELPSEALQTWRHVKEAKPALVLLSIHPFLDRIDPQRQQDIADLIATGDAETFRQRGSFYRVNPALVPTQAVSAAIANELFSELIWVIPTRVDVEELSLDVFRKQAIDANFLTEEEGQTLTYSEGVISGMVRGLPFRAVHPDTMPDMTEPIVLHVDTGYFKGMFKNEVATPLYDILHQTIMRLMQNEWQVYATTLSWSTEELMFSLDVRFLVTALARMIEDPNLMEQMPRSWKLHADAMYMGNMYMESKSRELIEEAAVAAPNDAAIVYALSQVRFQQGRADEAFTLLDKAVELDPGYGAAYLQLAEKGVEKKQLDKALELQRKAARHYPENPFLKVGEADILIRMGKADEAIEIISDLQQLPWSPYFHGNAAAQLNSMAEYARKPQLDQQPENKQEQK